MNSQCLVMVALFTAERGYGWAEMVEGGEPGRGGASGKDQNAPGQERETDRGSNPGTAGRRLVE